MPEDIVHQLNRGEEDSADREVIIDVVVGVPEIKRGDGSRRLCLDERQLGGGSRCSRLLLQIRTVREAYHSEFSELRVQEMPKHVVREGRVMTQRDNCESLLEVR